MCQQAKRGAGARNFDHDRDIDALVEFDGAGAGLLLRLTGRN